MRKNRVLNKNGFTLIELVIAMTLLALAVALSVSAINYGNRASQNLATAVLANFSTVEGSFNLYYSDKNAYPTDLADTTFVPAYLFIPKLDDNFDKTFGVSGFFLGQKTTGAANENGWYVCVKTANAVKDVTTDSIGLALAIASTSAGPNKLFYGTADCSTPANAFIANTAPANAIAYITYWVTRY